MSDKEKQTKNSFMTLIGYKQAEDGSEDKPKGEEEFTYKVMVNPDDFVRTFSFQYAGNDTTSSGSTAGKHTGTGPESYSFTLLIDGTGIIDEKRKSVKHELESLMKVLFVTTDSGYVPNHVEISYCDDLFHCTVSNFKVSYTLFNTDGTPLRAKVTCDFKSIAKKTPDGNPESSSGKSDTSTSKQPVAANDNSSAEAVISTSTKNDIDSLMCTILNGI